VVKSARAIEGSKTYTKKGANKVANKAAPLRKNVRLQRAYTVGKKEYAGSSSTAFEPASPVRGKVKQDVFRLTKKVQSGEMTSKAAYMTLMMKHKDAVNAAKANKKVNYGTDQATIAGQYRKAASRFAGRMKKGM
jgi:hypothetical protein